MGNAMENVLEKIKIVLRENEIPFFSDDEINLQLELHDNDFYMTVYTLAIAKAENCQMSLSGLSLADTSEYWLRIAQTYRPNNTVILE